MKKHSLIFLLILLILITSCSQVFEAGVSGKVVTKVGDQSQGVSDAYVYSYTDKQAYQKDFAKFESGDITSPSGGYVPRNVTNANGEFTINKIVWETKKSMFGRTADVANLYLIFYHEDYKPCGYGPVSIISGSTNASSVEQVLEQVRFAMPVFSSQISTGDNNKYTTGDDSSLDKYDDQTILLTDAEFNLFDGVGAVAYTNKVEHGVDTLSYSHGHFSGLGAGLKWEYPDGKTSIVVNIVWDVNRNGEPDTGDLYYPVTVSRTTTGIPSKITFDTANTI